MRFSNVRTIFQKEILDLFRDRRALISMLIVPLVVFPLLVSSARVLIPRLEQKSEEDAKALGIAIHVTTPSVRAALERTGYPIVEKDDPKAAVQGKAVSAGVEEQAGSPPQIRIYVDNTNPSSTAAAGTITEALTAARDQKIRDSLHDAGIDPGILRPFLISRTNIASQRKMSGAAWGSMLGYVLLLLMFTGGMYPIMDMTVGEKERKTMEAFLVSPALRREIVMGKTLAAIASILLTACLTLASMVYSFRGLGSGGSSPQAVQLRQTLGTIPLDARAISMIALTLIPLAIFAASTMFAIALKARTFKEAQTYLMPLMMLVIFPALLGGLPGLQISAPLCLIPIFNASQMIRGILLGEASMLNFGLTMAANLFYAGVAFFLATRMFEDEAVLFRS